MSKEKIIAIIGSGEMAVILVENAKKMGVETHSFSNNLHDRVVSVSDQHHDVSVFDTDRIVEICEDIGVNGVLPTTELTVSIAAIVSDALGFPGMPVELSKIITDKAFVREKAKGVKELFQPNFIVWTVGDSVPANLFYPVVVKPTSMGGK